MASNNFSMPTPRTGDHWVNPNTNVILNGPSEISNPSLRHYFGSDVEAAISAWGALSDEAAAVVDVRRIISNVLSEKKTKIHEVYFPDSKSYVAIVLEDVSDRGSIFIASGYVDHYVQLEESTPTKNGMIWRSLLPTSQQSSSSKALPPIPHVLCPNCFLQIPVTGQCGTCEWVPNPYGE